MTTKQEPTSSGSDPPYIKLLKRFAKLPEDKPISSLQQKQLTSCAINLVAGMILLILASALIYVASTDPKVATNRLYIYSVLIVLPIIIGGYLMVPALSGNVSSTKFMAIGLMLMALIICSYFLMKNMNMEQVIYANYFIMFVGIALGIALVFIGYKVGLRYLMSLDGWAGFIAKLILFLPCLVSDIIKEIIAVIPNLRLRLAAYVVLMATILGVLVYFGYYVIYKKGKNITNILGINLNGSQQPINISGVSGVDNINLKGTQYSLNSLKEISVPNSELKIKNYTIYFSIKLDAPAANANNVVAYKSNSTDVGSQGKPYIYLYGDNLCFVFSNQNDDQNTSPEAKDQNGKPLFTPDFTLPIPLQKWNNVAVVYDNNKVIVYLNGEMKKSVSLSSVGGPPKFDANGGEMLIVGQDNNNKSNAYGAIQALSYYPYAMTEQMIIAYSNTV